MPVDHTLYVHNTDLASVKKEAKYLYMKRVVIHRNGVGLQLRRPDRPE